VHDDEWCAVRRDHALVRRLLRCGSREWRIANLRWYPFSFSRRRGDRAGREDWTVRVRASPAGGRAVKAIAGRARKRARPRYGRGELIDRRMIAGDTRSHSVMGRWTPSSTQTSDLTRTIAVANRVDESRVNPLTGSRATGSGISWALMTVS